MEHELREVNQNGSSEEEFLELTELKHITEEDPAVSMSRRDLSKDRLASTS